LETWNVLLKAWNRDQKRQVVRPDARIVRQKGRSRGLKSRVVHRKTQVVPLRRRNVEDDGFIVLDAG
jgi:hypothetical protein